MATQWSALSSLAVWAAFHALEVEDSNPVLDSAPHKKIDGREGSV